MWRRFIPYQDRRHRIKRTFARTFIYLLVLFAFCKLQNNCSSFICMSITHSGHLQRFYIQFHCELMSCYILCMFLKQFSQLSRRVCMCACSWFDLTIMAWHQSTLNFSCSIWIMKENLFTSVLYSYLYKCGRTLSVG